ncbi:unnamed protein product [Auanema sp. JU1783]|nr:unnamed protein product [Auanema sp. JU1783]
MNGSGAYNAEADVQTNFVSSSMDNGRDVETSLLTNHTSRALPSNKIRKADAQKSCTCLGPRVFFVTFLFLAFLVICSLYFYNVVTVCSSKDCIISTARLLSNLDENIDPCTDFYEYACGAWINRTANLNYDAWNTLYSVTFAAHDRVVRAVFEHGGRGLPHKLNKGEQSVIRVFEQCADAESLAKIGTKPVNDLRKKLGGWMPDLDMPRSRRDLDEQLYELDDDDQLYILLKKTQERHRRQSKLMEPFEDQLLGFFNLSVFPLFFAGVQVNYKQSSEYIITIYEQVPLMPEASVYKEPEPQVEDLMNNMGPHQILLYLNTVGREMAELFGENYEGFQKRIAEMIVLEWKITNCRQPPSEFSNYYYQIITLDELQRRAPMLDWKYFLSGLTNHELSSDEKIALKPGMAWIEQLSRIIEEYRSSFEKQMILQSYMKWKVFVYFLSYTRPQCEIQQLWKFLTYYSGPRHLRKEFCILRLSGIFPLSSASLLRKIDGPENVDKTRQMVLEMAEFVRQELYGEWENSKNLDEKTKMNVLQKVLNMSIHSSFPDKALDKDAMEAESSRVGETFFESIKIGASAVYKETLKRLRQPVDEKDWIDTRPALSAIPIHNYERNLVLVPMDVLNPPIADYKQLDSLNYGAIGSFVGHEMSHAFDAEGKQHGPTGNLEWNEYWTEKSAQNYEDVISCVIEHYTNISGREQAIVSRRENIADIMGLEISYKAWKKHGRDRWVHSTVGDITPDQRFFLSFAQSWCALDGPGIHQAVHSKERQRVMGALSNSKSFSKAYQCPVGSRMNPKSKCDLW